MGAYRKNLQFGTISIAISNSEIVYETPKQKGKIDISGIEEIEIQKGKFFSFGHICIKSVNGEHDIEFPSKFNKDLLEWKQDFDSGKCKQNPQKMNNRKTEIRKWNTSKGKNDIECAEYKVVGKNPKTNRKKTVMVVGIIGEDKNNIAKRSGLLEPFEITQEIEPCPTEGQFKYANKLGIKFPNDATCNDASYMLTRAQDNKEIIQNKIPNELIEIAVYKLNVFIPRYAGIKDFDWCYYRTLGEKEKHEYFAMKVYCELYGKRYILPYEANEDEKALFEKFASENNNNRDFLESFSRYEIEDMPIFGQLKKRLKAYNIASDFLKKNVM